MQIKLIFFAPPAGISARNIGLILSSLVIAKLTMDNGLMTFLARLLCQFGTVKNAVNTLTRTGKSRRLARMTA